MRRQNLIDQAILSRARQGAPVAIRPHGNASGSASRRQFRTLAPATGDARGKDTGTKGD
jgi:hypothetical protein